MGIKRSPKLEKKQKGGDTAGRVISFPSFDRPVIEGPSIYANVQPNIGSPDAPGYEGGHTGPGRFGGTNPGRIHSPTYTLEGVTVAAEQQIAKAQAQHAAQVRISLTHPCCG